MCLDKMKIGRLTYVHIKNLKNFLISEYTARFQDGDLMK